MRAAVLLSSLLLLPLFPAGQALSQSGDEDEEELTLQVKQVSCSKGAYRVKLPRTYAQLKRMGTLKRERVLYEEDLGSHRVSARELRFVGLEMVVYTHSDKPGQYQLARIAVLTPRWRLTGPLRVGTTTSVALKGVPAKPLPRNGEITLEGEHDSILLTVAGGRLQAIDYECATE